MRCLIATCKESLWLATLSPVPGCSWAHVFHSDARRQIRAWEINELSHQANNSHVYLETFLAHWAWVRERTDWPFSGPPRWPCNLLSPWDVSQGTNPFWRQPVSVHFSPHFSSDSLQFLKMENFGMWEVQEELFTCSTVSSIHYLWFKSYSFLS